MIGSLTQWHILPMVTPAAILRCVGRIDFDKLPASFFRFARQLSKECRPRGICNAFGKTMVVDHTVDLEVFYADDAKGIDDLATLLMGEISSSEADTFMHTGNGFAVLAPFWCALCQFGMLPLDFGQGFLFLAEKPGVLDRGSIREGGKGLESYVNADLGRYSWQAFRFAFYRKGDIPLASRGTVDGAGLDLALDGSITWRLSRRTKSAVTVNILVISTR